MPATKEFIRKSDERGHANHGWLDSNHTFSFADYYDPEFMGFSVLRVINEDKIAGGTGFGMHPHRDMEILSYVVEGALEHRDSMGNTAVIRPGEVQRMSAGTGVRHSEKNHSETETGHFYQIWILPERAGIEPGYGQKSFADELAKGELVLAASRSGRSGSIAINQDVDMYIGKLKAGALKQLDFGPQRNAWVQVVKGRLEVNGLTLDASDGAGLTDVSSLSIKPIVDTEVIIFNLP